ncbi:hypothetical protein BV20DRAFT_330294 [Pilatotrama ljubarskyi]|nr:hypothetical protein BV20DRAFT_330294 [Pilatotrama ljubarskyi]
MSTKEGSESDAPEDWMTGATVFMATELLHAIDAKTPIDHTVSHDLQSFCWVILYLLHRGAIVKPLPCPRKKESATPQQDPGSDFTYTLAGIKDEYNKLFTAMRAEGLVDGRAHMFLGSSYHHSLENLWRYFRSHGHGSIAALVAMLFKFLERCEPVIVKADKLKDSHVPAGLARMIARVQLPGEADESNPLVTPSKFALEFAHEDVIELLQVCADSHVEELRWISIT